MPEVILPGTYITVRDEALISVGRIATGNIGIVGTANKGPINEVKIIGNFTEAKAIYGDIGPWSDDPNSPALTLLRAIEQIYNNGGRTVYAVRTASDAAANAAFQLKDASNGDLFKIEALSPGSWGNDIGVKIEAADSPAIVSEELAGDSSRLNRLSVEEDGLNIAVRKPTGQVVRYDVVFNAAPDDTKREVGVNPDGTIVFTALAEFVPTAQDKILARYQVPQGDALKVQLLYGELKETYIIADAAHLAEQINRVSTLASAPPDAKDLFVNQQLATKADKFGTGLDGNTEGFDGTNANANDYKDSLALLENEIVNIVLLGGQSVSASSSGNAMSTVLQGHLDGTADNRRERIGLIGSDGTTDVNKIVQARLNVSSDRLIFVAPGVKSLEGDNLPGAYTAAAVAGLLSSLPVQASPTNKVLNVPGLAVEFNYSKLEKLVQEKVLVIEKKSGFRVVKGITTSENSAWHQVTTRRIVDFAKYGVRSACNPYIGKLNNDRVRGAMKTTIDAFLTRMVNDEALIGYELSVSATRAQEIAGEAIVEIVLQPAFSIDFVKVTMYLQ